MGGDGEGVLTILQRLDDAGVVLTVVNRSREEQQQKKSERKQTLPAVKGPQKVTKETSTDTLRLGKQTDKHIQISDDRFASSYQVDHCKVRPSSPPVPLSEFPPQRSRPSYNGNFEVGGLGSCVFKPNTRCNDFRGGLTWPDRGSVHRSKSSQYTDAFAHSLRKYPRCLPARTVSSELVAKILKYNHSKYSQEAARTKSNRSLPKEKTPDSYQTRKQTRNIQTYVRAHNTIENRRLNNFVTDDSFNTLENKLIGAFNRTYSRLSNKGRQERLSAKECATGSRNDSHRNTRRRSRNNRLQSPMSDSGDLNHIQNDLLNTTYDYLKVSQPSLSKQQLHLDKTSREEVWRAIRQVYNHQPVVFQVCPNIQKRFDQHKKHCPVANNQRITMNTQDEASMAGLCGLLTATTGCGMPSRTRLQLTALPELRSYCQCTKSSQCGCDLDSRNECVCCPNLSNKTVQYDVDCECDPEPYIETYPCECDPESDEEYYNLRIDEEIIKWLDEIPVHGNEHPDDRKLREDLANELAEMLKQLPDDDNFENSAKDLIEKCVYELPMWNPGTKQDKENLKAKVAENLLDKIIAIPRKADKIKDAVTKFIDNINFSDDVDRKSVTDKIVNKLKDFAANAPKNEEEYKDLLIAEIAESLKDLPIKFEGSKSVLINVLANQLAWEVKDHLRYVEIYTGAESLKENFKTDISKWLNEVTKLSENAPDSQEAKKIINDLAAKLDKLQNEGVDESTKIKMENEIRKVLELLKTPEKAVSNFTDTLMENITDVTHAKEKTKIERAHRQETFKELSDWLKNIEGASNLNQTEQYQLNKEMVDKIVDIKDKGGENYHDIFDSLTGAGINVDPDLKDKLLGELTTRLKTLETKVQKKDLKENIRKNVHDAINQLKISEDKKAEMKNKLVHVLDKKVEATSLTKKKDIEGMKDVLLEEVDDIIKESHIPEEIQNDLKDKLDSIMSKHVGKLLSAKEKDTMKFQILKEMNYAIDKEPIPDEEKNDLKYKLKQLLKDNLDMLISKYVKDNINENIGTIIKEAPIQKEIKDSLINKLQTIATKLDELPTETMKDHTKDKTVKDIKSVMQKVDIPDDLKNDLVQTLKYMLHEKLMKPFSCDVKEAILSNVSAIVGDSSVPKSEVDDLINKLRQVVGENLGALPYQTAADHAKETMMTDMHDVLDDVSMDKKQLLDFKQDLTRMLADILDRPYTSDQTEKLKQNMTNKIENLPVTSEIKQELISKLTEIAKKQLEQLPYQTAEEFAKNTILRDLTHIVDKTSLLTEEKNKLNSEFASIIDEGLQNANLSGIREVMQDKIDSSIRQSSMPRDEQDDLIKQMTNVVNSILDEAYYEDTVREDLDDMYDLIDKALMDKENKDVLRPKLKKFVDDYSQKPEYANLKGILKESLGLVEQPSDEAINVLDDTKIADIKTAFEEASIPHEEKGFLENKLNEILTENLENPKDSGEVLKELEKTIEELYIPLDDKTDLKQKAAKILSRISDELQNQLRKTLTKDIGAAIDLESIGKDKKSTIKNKINNMFAYLDEPISGEVKDKIKAALDKILDENVFSKDKRSHMKTKLGNIVDKLSTHVQDRNIFKKKVVTRTGDVIDEAPIRLHIKKNLKSQLNKIILDNLKRPMKGDTKSKITSGVANLIKEAPITQYQKDDLTKKLADILSKELEQLPMSSGNQKHIILRDINKILDDESFSKAIKSELKDKLRKAIGDNLDKTPSAGTKKKTMQSIHEVIDDIMIPENKKSDLKTKLENTLKTIFAASPSPSKTEEGLSAVLANDVFEVIDETPILEEKKIHLKKKIEAILSQNLKQLMSDNIKDTINKQITDMIEEIALSKSQKRDLISDITGTVSQTIDEFHTEVRKGEIRESFFQEIDSLIDQLQISYDQKSDLKQELKDKIDENLEHPLVAKTLRAIKQDLSNLIDEAPIPSEKKTEINEKLSVLIDKHTEPLLSANVSIKSVSEDDTRRGRSAIEQLSVADMKDSVFEEINSILEQLDIPQIEKNNLKQKFNDMLTEHLDKPLTFDTLEYLKDNFNNIITEASIPENVKEELRTKLFDIIERSVKSLSIASSLVLSSRRKLASQSLLFGMDSILDMFEITDDGKETIKRDLINMIIENSQQPMQVIEEYIDNIIEKVPIPDNQKSELKDKIINMIDRNKKRQDIFFQKSVSDTKLKVFQGIDSILDQTDISENHKNNLKQKLKGMLDESFKKPLTGDALKIIKDNISDIVSKSSIPSNQKDEIKRQLFTLVEDTIKSVFDENGRLLPHIEMMGLSEVSMMTPEQKEEIKATILQKMNTALDQQKIPTDSKTDIKSKLKNLLDEQFKNRLTNNIVASIKDGIREIITAERIAQEKIDEIINLLIGILDENMVYESGIQSVKIADTILPKIDSCLQLSQINSEQKNEIKNKIIDMIIENLNRPISIEDFEEIKRNINDIIDAANIPKDKKTELKSKMLQIIDEDTEYLSDVDHSANVYKRTIAAMRYENATNDSTNHTKSPPSYSGSQTPGSPSYDADDEDTKNDASSVLGSRTLSVINKPKQKKKDPKRAITMVDSKSDEENSDPENAYNQKKMLKATHSVIDKLPIPDHLKDQMKGKVAGVLPEDVVKSAQIRSTGSVTEKTQSSTTSQEIGTKDFTPIYQDRGVHSPVTSTPKKGRKNWEPPSMVLSTIADEPSHESLQPEVRSYWKDIEKIVANWLDSLPIHLNEEKKRAVLNEIASDIADRQKYLELNPSVKQTRQGELDYLQYRIFSMLNKIVDDRSISVVMQATGELMQSMQEVPYEDVQGPGGPGDQLDVEIDWTSPERVQRYIQRWLDKLPYEPNFQDHNKLQTLASHLMERIKEMNANPDIFNDDSFYGEMLKYELETILDELPIDMKKISDKEKEFINKIKGAKRTHKGKAGLSYKQQLRDTISKTLPEQGDLSAEDIANFEILKAEVADAFVNLNYSGGSEEQRNKLKKKIHDEVNKFCDDYLKKHPDKPVDAEKLNRDLFAALKKVALPSEDSMKEEVENVRLKSVVNEWMEELPLKPQSAEEHLQTTQKVAILASKLRHIEQNSSLSNSELKREMEKEITKFIKRLPIQPGQEGNIDSFTKKMIEKLEATASTRKFDASTRYSIALDDAGGICPYFKSLQDRQKHMDNVRRKIASSQTRHPPCSITPEEREHLERIRQRTCMAPDCLASLMRGDRHNASVSPMPIDTGSQTHANFEAYGNPPPLQPCPSTMDKPCPGVPSVSSRQYIPQQYTKSICVQSGPPDLPPQVIIKEYYWDSNDGPEDTEMTPPRAPLRHQHTSTQRIPCIPTMTPPCPAARPQRCPQCVQHKSIQICQEKPSRASLPCTSSPCSPRPCTPKPCRSPISQIFVPPQQSTPRSSNGPFMRANRDGMDYPEASSSRFSRKERVIELGSLDDLRKPSQKNRRFEEHNWYNRFPEDEFWGTCSRHIIEDESELPLIREKKEERVRCKCKERVMMSCGRRRQHGRMRDCAVGSTCNDASVRHCSKCCGSHCPYPSYMFFKQ